MLGCGGKDAENSPQRRRFLPPFHRCLDNTCLIYPLTCLGFLSGWPVHVLAKPSLPLPCHFAHTYSCPLALTPSYCHGWCLLKLLRPHPPSSNRCDWVSRQLLSPRRDAMQTATCWSFVRMLHLRRAAGLTAIRVSESDCKKQ